MLIINDLSKKFRKKEVLHPLDLTTAEYMACWEKMEREKLRCCAVLPGCMVTTMEVFPLQIRQVNRRA